MGKAASKLRSPIQLLKIVLKARQRAEQLHSEWITAKSGAIPANKARIEPGSRAQLLGYTDEGKRQESSNGFPEQREPRFSHLRGPGVELASERKESCSCQEILEFRRWRWHAAACDLVSPDSGESNAMSL